MTCKFVHKHKGALSYVFTSIFFAFVPSRSFRRNLIIAATLTFLTKIHQLVIWGFSRNSPSQPQPILNSFFWWLLLVFKKEEGATMPLFFARWFDDARYQRILASFAKSKENQTFEILGLLTRRPRIWLYSVIFILDFRHADDDFVVFSLLIRRFTSIRTV